MLKVCQFEKKYYLCIVNHKRRHAQLAELVDALVSNTSAARHAGSIPALGTKAKCCNFLLQHFFFYQMITSSSFYVFYPFILKKNNYMYFIKKLCLSFLIDRVFFISHMVKLLRK